MSHKKEWMLVSLVICFRYGMLCASKCKVYNLHENSQEVHYNDRISKTSSEVNRNTEDIVDIQT